MRVPISWLKDYVDIDMSPAQLADLLTKGGLEVESVDLIGIEGAELVWDREKVLLGQILSVEQHPNADKLVLATVDVGAAESKTVVTGAPNLKPYVGQGDLSQRKLFGPVIFEGADYRDPYKDGKITRLKGRELRGIYNDAMICSEIELGLGDDHDGVILIEQGPLAPNYQPGTPLQDVLGDAVLDIDILPNVARAASILGVAREIAALTGQTYRPPSYELVMEGDPIDGRVTIKTENPELNPRFVALLIEGVTQKPSPYWMRRRLHLAGQRPINVVVDISNYVMLEMGQPNHTFDWDFLRSRAEQIDTDGNVQIITRLAAEYETLQTLDGKVHELHPNNILVTDPLGALSLGGIMGGYNSEIQDATTNVLLEAAAWNFINIRHSQRQLGIFSEAGFRFSRGVHPSQALLGAKRAAELLRVLAGGVIAAGIVDTYPHPPQKVRVRLELDYAQRLSGLQLWPDEMAALLEQLEFTIDELGDDYLVAIPPDYRLDIEGPHDLVEEICRIYGYDRIPTTVLQDSLPPQSDNREFEIEEQIKDLLVRLDLQEVITYRLTTADAEARALVGPPDDLPYVTLVNPPTQTRVSMRHSLLASLLEVAAQNTRFVDRIGLFEIGTVFFKDEEAVLPQEPVRLAIVLTGPRQPGHWSENGKIDTYDFYDLKGKLEALFDFLHLRVRFEADTHPSLRPGRTARIYIGDSQKQVGIIGELHPTVVSNYEMRLDDGQPLLAAEIYFDALLPALPDGLSVTPLPQYPPVREDLAFVVDSKLSAAAVHAELQKAGGYLLKEVELFDVYEGEHIGQGKKSLAYHLTFQADDKTLKDKDVARLRKRIIKQLKNNLGAALRG